MLPKDRQEFIDMQVLPSVDTGRRVHHRDWPRTGPTVLTRGRDLGEGAVGRFSDRRREVPGGVVGWRLRFNFGEGWIRLRRLSGMREACFEAGAQIPKSSHLAGAPSFPTPSRCERVHKVARATGYVQQLF